MKYVFALAALLILTTITSAFGANMYRCDLQSLAYLSTAVAEGDVIADETIHWVDKLTFKVTKVYQGDVKPDSVIVVGLSAYGKVQGDTIAGRFGKGDHLIVFIEPATQKAWKDDGISYWPVPSGLKLVSNGKVTGVEQVSNPGAYLNVIAEGEIEQYRKKIESAVTWASAFRKAFKEKKSDVKWLIEQLRARPELKKETWGVRDHIAVALCEAIRDSGDKDAIVQAKAIRQDRYEHEVLDLPPAK